ncbi:type IV pilus biogenesis protein PilP [Brenneria izbisi]|uniref:Type IV pilus biogenesis protein PilP n=1 Tax=Brenneria izbisi TaxID=2939450 RepID=A0AA41XXP4_9GAMM|nr:type IV pilus biogenesis protein PilP [Brenneria izbisi]MCV9879283.1 type IV pilus biogenesis protein PilP [Brenneria izbisi]MCV9883881.1 type IV pilus biogenesis protein PilP [Brenneria izbisi]
MRKNNHWGLLSMLFIFSVQAEDVDSNAQGTLPDTPVTVGQLEAVQAHNMLLAAQVESAKLQRMLKESQLLPIQQPSVAPSASMPISLPAGTTLSQSGSVATTQPLSGTGKATRPVLLGTYGNGKAMFARLRLGNGGTIEIAKGDRIPGADVTVSAISDSVVKLSDGTSLSF